MVNNENESVPQCPLKTFILYMTYANKLGASDFGEIIHYTEVTLKCKILRPTVTNQHINHRISATKTTCGVVVGSKIYYAFGCQFAHT